MKIIKHFARLDSIAIWFILLISCLMLGCKAGDPHQGVYDASLSPDGFVLPDLPPGCPSVPVLQAPVLDPFPNPTAYGLQPFRGVVPGANSGQETITSQGGTGSFKANIGTDGRFCLEVQLTLDSPNNITFLPFDKNGCPGQATTIYITHKSAAQVDASLPTIQNLAKDQPISAAADPDEGLISFINDGDENSFAELSFYDWDVLNSTCDAFTWIRVDLGKAYTVSQVKIKYPPQVEDYWAKCYGVLASQLDAPVDPDPAEVTEWVTVEDKSTGTETEQIIDIAPQPARWIALLLYENNRSSLWEAFRVAELEVWGQDPDAQPPPPPDRCEN